MKRFLLITVFVLFWSQSAFAKFNIKNVVGCVNTSDTCSIAPTGTPVLSGDLIIVYAIWQVDIGAASFSDGQSTFTAGTRNTGGAYTNGNGQMFYLLSSVATGLPTYTLTATGSSGPTFAVYIFTPTGAVSADAHIESNSAANTSIDSGALSATSGDTLVFAGASQATDTTPITAFAIGGSSASTNSAGFNTGQGTTFMSWYLEISGSVHATATSTVSAEWEASAISFHISGGGGGSTQHSLSLMGAGQ